MKTSLIPRLCLSGIALLMLTGNLYSSLIFLDDFSGYEEGSYTGSLGQWTLSAMTAGRTLTVLKDTGDLFGRGTENNYLTFQNTGDSAMSMALINGLPAGHSVITVSFNWIYPELAGNTRSFGIRAGVNSAAGDDLANLASFSRTTSGGTRQGQVGSGTDALFSLNSPHRFDIVFNSSASTIFYEGGTLDSKKYDVWIDGEKIASGLSNFDKFSGDLRTVMFRTDSSSPNLAYLDWVAVYSGAQIMAPIPEPSTLILLGGAVGGISILRRRKSAR